MDVIILMASFTCILTQYPLKHILFLDHYLLCRNCLSVWIFLWFFRVEYVSMENVTLRKKLDALESNNR